jgi:hypothetical protein
LEKPAREVFWDDEEFRLRVEASDNEGVQLVLFEWNRPGVAATSQFTVTDRQPPYEAVWKLPPGSWRLTVSALDIVGALSRLPPYDVVVKSPQPLTMIPQALVLGSPNSWKLSWTGGKGPYQLQRARQLSPAPAQWEPLLNTAGFEYVWKPDTDRSYFRIIDLGRAP